MTHLWAKRIQEGESEGTERAQSKGESLREPKTEPKKAELREPKESRKRKAKLEGTESEAKRRREGTERSPKQTKGDKRSESTVLKLGKAEGNRKQS